MLVASGLQPHRIRTFTFSPDPDFEAKLLDIVGLYLNPPEHALVLCVNEKTGIQALDPYPASVSIECQEAPELDQRVRPSRHPDPAGSSGDRERRGRGTPQTTAHFGELSAIHQ
jgi:hypothetical protein